MSVRAEVRFTRDVDLAVVVSDDPEVEHLVRELAVVGYRAIAVVEHDTRGRIATVRLSAPSGIVVDLVTASSGIEREIVERAVPVAFEAAGAIPVARAEELLAMKVLSMTDSHNAFQPSKVLRALARGVLMSHMGDLLGAEERAQIMARGRPVRALPMLAKPRRTLPLADPRPQDDTWRPILAVWETTLRCDLACRHCGSRAGHVREGELSTAECVDLVRQLAELGTREVAVIGGEAYLREDWLDILRAIRAHGMMATMTTGGRNFTRERAEAAAAAGLASVSVSIDGEEETHDRLRGVRGSHRSAFEALENLRAAGIATAVNTQINRLSMAELPRVFARIAEARVRSWQLQLTVAMGRAADEPDVLLQPYDLLGLFPMLADLKARADGARIQLVAGNNIGYFGPHEALLRGRTRKGHCSGCGAGRATIGIEADGTIKGCPSLGTANWAGGNVRETPIAEIWKRATPLRYTRDRSVKDLWGYCATCYYADECRAGCTWTGDSLFGRPGNNPYCHHRALEMDRAGKRERLVRIAAPPGESFDHGLFEIVVEDRLSETPSRE